MTCKDANWMQEKWGLVRDILDLTKVFFPHKRRLCPGGFPNFTNSFEVEAPFPSSLQLTFCGAFDSLGCGNSLATSWREGDSGERHRSGRRGRGAAALGGNRQASRGHDQLAGLHRLRRGLGAPPPPPQPPRQGPPPAHHPEQGGPAKKPLPSSLSWLTSTAFP